MPTTIDRLPMLRRSEAFAEDLVDTPARPLRAARPDPAATARRRRRLGGALLFAVPTGVSLLAAAWFAVSGVA